ncbi:MAG: DEAD/DEAH box helicase, partial [Nitrospira sp.]
MTTHELEQLLMQQPVSLLHRLARGRISRHFRSGKRKLVELLLQASAENRPGLESDLAALIEEQAHRQQATPVETPPKPKGPTRPATSPISARPHRADDHGHHEPPVSLHEWLSGIGIPQAQPFVPDPWQVEALARLAETDVVVSVPTGSGKTYVAIEATKRAMQENRTVIYTSPLKALSNT